MKILTIRDAFRQAASAVTQSLAALLFQTLDEVSSLRSPNDESRFRVSAPSAETLRHPRLYPKSL